MIKQIVMSILIYFRYQYSVFHAIRFAKTKLCPTLRINFLTLRQIVFSGFLTVSARFFCDSTYKKKTGMTSIFAGISPYFSGVPDSQIIKAVSPGTSRILCFLFFSGYESISYVPILV
ncbi:MAG TPA: hypothetical protein DCY03_19325 [Planctomycetaceae bacterium]|nr:hypothetical protein [Planctomycetaceae bacterium]